MALSVGDSAPDFDLPQAQDAGDNIKLSDFKGEKNVLLCFFPFDFSPVCSEQLPVYSAQADRFERANCQVLGISVAPSPTPPGPRTPESGSPSSAISSGRAPSRPTA